MFPCHQMTYFLLFTGNKFLSADFRQLELRILAHLSGDESLKEALLSGDVFINIAAKWNHVPAEEVQPHISYQIKGLLPIVTLLRTFKNNSERS